MLHFKLVARFLCHVCPSFISVLLHFSCDWFNWSQVSGYNSCLILSLFMTQSMIVEWVMIMAQSMILGWIMINVTVMVKGYGRTNKVWISCYLWWGMNKGECSSHHVSASSWCEIIGGTALGKQTSQWPTDWVNIVTPHEYMCVTDFILSVN